MSLTVVRIGEHTADEAGATRVKHHIEEHQECYSRIRDALGKVYANPSRYTDRLLISHNNIVEYWQRRTGKVERTLRAMLAADVLNDEQRGKVFDVLHGGRIRDAKCLSKPGRDLVAAYRAMDTKGRSMLVALAQKLAEASASPKGDIGNMPSAVPNDSTAQV